MMTDVLYGKTRKYKMRFNINSLEKYKTNILKKKRGYRFDDNISIYFIAGTWIFAVRNRIRIRKLIKQEY